MIIGRRRCWPAISPSSDMDARHSVPPKVPPTVAVSNTPTVTVHIAKGERGFGMRISAEGVVTAYSAPGGAAEVRGGR